MRTHEPNPLLFIALALVACELEAPDKDSECHDPGPLGMATMDRIEAACANFAHLAAGQARTAVSLCGQVPADTVALVPDTCFTDLETRLAFECRQAVLCAYDVEVALDGLTTACGGNGTLDGAALSLGQDACDWWPAVEATDSCGGAATTTGFTLPVSAYDLCPCMLTGGWGDDTQDTAGVVVCH